MSWRAPPGPVSKAVRVPAPGWVVANRRVTEKAPWAGCTTAFARTVPVASLSWRVMPATRLRPVTCTGLTTVWPAPGAVTTMAPPAVGAEGLVVLVAEPAGDAVVEDVDPAPPAAEVEVAERGDEATVVAAVPAVDGEELHAARTSDRASDGASLFRTSAGNGRTTAFWCMTRPTPEDLRQAAGRTIPDLVAPDLAVLFCGINPGLWSGASGLHFARPGNRFWKVLHGAGFTPRVLDPSEQGGLPALGIGITNLVARTTTAASELSADELRAGALALERKVRRLRPRIVAFVGMQAYRTAFRRPKAGIGPQPETLARSAIWLLPNPSGLQARYQLAEMIEAFAALRAEAYGPATGIPRAGRRFFPR